MFWALQELVGPGDHAIVTVPNYQSMETLTLRTGAEVSGWGCARDDGWAPDLTELRRAAARTRGWSPSTSRTTRPARSRPGDVHRAGRAVRRAGIRALQRRGVSRPRARPGAHAAAGVRPVRARAVVERDVEGLRAAGAAHRLARIARPRPAGTARAAQALHVDLQRRRRASSWRRWRCAPATPSAPATARSSRATSRSSTPSSPAGPSASSGSTRRAAASASRATSAATPAASAAAGRGGGRRPAARRHLRVRAGVRAERSLPHRRRPPRSGAGVGGARLVPLRGVDRRAGQARRSGSCEGPASVGGGKLDCPGALSCWEGVNLPVVRIFAAARTRSHQPRG